MSSITKIFTEQSFASFEEVQEFFKKAPYHFEVKSDDNLFMLCMTEETDLNNPVCREATGIIFEKETNKVVHYSFAKAYEGFKQVEGPVSFDTDLLLELDESEHICIDRYFEGSLIKVYHYDDKWHTATSKHLNADTNRWGSKNSFEKLFADCISKTYETNLDSFTDSLNKEFCYTFLIQHPDHIMTTNVSTEMCFALNKVNLETLEETLEEPGILTTSFKKVQEILENNKKITDNYLVYHFDNEGKVKNRIKMLSPEFLKLKEKLGNLPNIGLRYLQQFDNDEDKAFLRVSYSQCCEIFDKVDTLFYKTAKTALFIYNKKFVKKDPSATVSYRFSKLMTSLHENANETPVNFESIVKTLKALSPRELAFVINYIY